MKVKEINKGFKPFTIELTIESIEELKNLHNRINISTDEVNDAMDNKWCNSYAMKLFDTLHNKLIEHVEA